MMRRWIGFSFDEHLGLPDGDRDEKYIFLRIRAALAGNRRGTANFLSFALYFRRMHLLIVINGCAAVSKHKNQPKYYGRQV
jgi:hypothetical protein